MKEYGYLWDGMNEISYEDALKLFNGNKSVFLLYENNTEAQVESQEDITKHYNNGGLFGAEKHADTDNKMKKIKVQCLGCGHEFLITSNDLSCDELGHFTICPVCGGSFDINIQELILNNTHYTKCEIQFIDDDDDTRQEIIIKSNDEYIEDEDDDVFFFGLDYNKIVEFCKNSEIVENEWKITKVVGVSNEI